MAPLDNVILKMMVVLYALFWNLIEICLYELFEYHNQEVYFFDIFEIIFCISLYSHTNYYEVHLQPTEEYPFHLSSCVLPEFVICMIYFDISRWMLVVYHGLMVNRHYMFQKRNVVWRIPSSGKIEGNKSLRLFVTQIKVGAYC